jgi:cytochrome P450 family 6
MSYTLYEMATNSDLQKRAQEEIDSLLSASKGELSEEVINKMEFLDNCVMETVRIHCPVWWLSKISLKETEFPPQYESGTQSLKVEAGTNVVIPVYALHL